MGMNNILEIKGLTKSYPGFHLGPLSFAIPEGAIVGYIGENGAGKSTTIKLILGLVSPDSGEVSIFGQKMDDDPKGIRDQIGKRIYRHWNQVQFEDYLAKYNLTSNKLVKDLSRGMKMKLSLAIALSHEARLLLLDEPTSGLDPVVREELLDILLEFIQDERRSVFISSHILSDLEKVADYIAFIHEGQLIFLENKDLLQDEYVLYSCDSQAAKQIDPEAIIGRRKNQFGEKLLLRRSFVPQQLELERPSIEDIMLFYIKGEKI